MAFIFSRLPPSISVPLFYIAITGLFLTKFFVANLFGILLLACALYSSAPSLLGIEPFNFAQLVEWFSVQQDATKTSLLGSIITVLGFLIAFASASYNWRSQALSQLRTQAAAEIDGFFAQCAQRATDCQLYAKGLIEAVGQIHKGCDSDEAMFLARYHREKTNDFEKHKQELIALRIESHRLLSRYANLMALSPGVIANMQIAIEALRQITDAIWFERPFIVDGDPDPVESFLYQTNISECIKFSKAVDDNFVNLNFSSGMVRGSLQSSVVGFGFWSLVFLYSEIPLIRSAVAEHYESRRKI